MSARSPSPIDQHIAGRLAAARRNAKLSQEQAAEVLGVTFQQLQKYEKGTNRLSVGRLAQLAELYGRPIEWFYAGRIARKTTPDLGVAMQEAKLGVRMIEAFLSIEDIEVRHLVVDMAERLGRKPRARAALRQAAE
jgi:transcriptional regulator with XRE-family HTH domain